MLKEGDRIPDFSLSDQDGKLRTPADFAGKPLVVYFYPKDDTPGCTKEACSFRDAYAELRAKGAAVVGISADGAASHLKFARKYELPFTLLADPEKTTIQAFGAWGEKSMYGKTYEGILRSTFVVGADGIVKKVFPKVSPAEHAAEVLAAL
jgi:peroxiredoxin Q/BCP